MPICTTTGANTYSFFRADVEEKKNDEKKNGSSSSKPVHKQRHTWSRYVSIFFFIHSSCALLVCREIFSTQTIFSCSLFPLWCELRGKAYSDSDVCCVRVFNLHTSFFFFSFFAHIGCEQRSYANHFSGEKDCFLCKWPPLMELSDDKTENDSISKYSDAVDIDLKSCCRYTNRALITRHHRRHSPCVYECEHRTSVDGAVLCVCACMGTDDTKNQIISCFIEKRKSIDKWIHE